MSLFIQYNLWFFADNLLSHRQTFVDAFQILKTSNILGHSPRQNSVHRSDYCFGLTLLLPIGYSRRYRFTVEVEVSPFSVEIFHFHRFYTILITKCFSSCYNIEWNIMMGHLYCHKYRIATIKPTIWLPLFLPVEMARLFFSVLGSSVKRDREGKVQRNLRWL